MAKCLVRIGILLLAHDGHGRKHERGHDDKHNEHEHGHDDTQEHRPPIVLTPPGADTCLSTFSDAFNRDDSDGIMVSLDIGMGKDHKHHDTRSSPRLDASATILRTDASRQLLLSTLDEAYFGYVWRPQDNLKALDCCYYRDGATVARTDLATGRHDGCGVVPRGAAKVLSAAQWERQIIPPIFCNGTVGENCIKRMLSAAKAHGCPQCDAPLSENEVVILRGQIQSGKVRDSLASLSARNKPWPVALVLTYSTQGALNTTQAVRAQLLSTGMLRRQQETFANETLVLVIEQPHYGWSGEGGAGVGRKISMLTGLVRLDELAAFLKAPRGVARRRPAPSCRVSSPS